MDKGEFVQRRDFCNLLAIAAASKALPSSGRTAQESQPGFPSGFNQSTQDYAQFCAQPPEKRVFYKVSDGKIIEERLEEAAWQPPAWNYNPVAQSVASGLWDDVPLTSPIPDLAGDGLFKPTWDSLLEYEAPDRQQGNCIARWHHGMDADQW
jgi:alpha-L-fucosidase